jgi:tetratricopeptide (TPR) repeat protein
VDHIKALLLGERYVRLERGERALEALEHASPEIAWTWLWRANALHLMKRYDDAIESARKGLALAPEDPYLHHALARALFQLGRTQEADAAIRESLRIDPEGADALAVHAMILTAAGKHSQAQSVIARAVELGPDSRHVRGMDAFLRLGSESSHERTRELLRSAPEGPHEHWLHGMSLLKIGRLREASNHFIRAAVLQPENSLFVRTALYSRHWLIWPLRVTSPMSMWIGKILLPLALWYELYFGSAGCRILWHSVAYVLYTWLAMLMIVRLPFERENRI